MEAEFVAAGRAIEQAVIAKLAGVSVEPVDLNPAANCVMGYTAEALAAARVQAYDQTRPIENTFEVMDKIKEELK